MPGGPANGDGYQTKFKMLSSKRYREFRYSINIQNVSIFFEFDHKCHKNCVRFFSMADFIVNSIELRRFYNEHVYRLTRRYNTKKYSIFIVRIKDNVLNVEAG